MAEGSDTVAVGALPEVGQRLRQRGVAVDVDVVSSDRAAEWDGYVNLAPTHDAFHHRDYATAVARGEPLLVVVRHASALWMLPVEVYRSRIVGVDTVDARSAYGYSGPVWTVDWPDGLHESAWRRVADTLCEMGVVTLLLRLHPTLPAPPVLPHGAMTRHEGDVVVMPLDIGEDAYWGTMRRGHRKNLRRALREELVVQVERGTSTILEFHSIYKATMDRLTTQDDYRRFGMEAFKQILQSPEVRAHLVTVRDRATLLAAGIFLAHGTCGHYFLSGSAVDHAYGSRPTRLMIHHARSVLASEGCSVLNLGGGLGARRDALFAFKAEFSDTTLPYRTVRWVLDGRRYGTRCHLAGMKEPPRLDDGWFPAYLAPVKAAVADEDLQ